MQRVCKSTRLCVTAMTRRLELIDGKLSRSVLRGGSGGDAVFLTRHCNRVYKVEICKRTSGKRGCPYCSNKRVCSDNALSVLFPKIANEWHPEKNGKLKPNAVIKYSNKRVWWLCSQCKREWQSTIGIRTFTGRGCPFCAGQRVTKENSLQTVFPKIAKEWHKERNGKLLPSQVMSKTKKKVWWRCGKNKEHEWEASVGSRTGLGTGCPYCSGNLVSDKNALSSCFPDISLLWHPTKNGKLTVHDVSVKSQKVVWWRCPKSPDHVFQKLVAAMTASSGKKNQGCPFCSGTQLCKTNTLAYRNPKLAKEFHPTLNGKLTAKTVFATTDKKLWWQCSRSNEHIWQASAYSRATVGTGCPHCLGRSWLTQERPRRR